MCQHSTAPVLYLSVRSGSSALGCVPSIHGGTPGDILVCDQQRHTENRRSYKRKEPQDHQQYKNVIWETVMVPFIQVNEGMKAWVKNRYVLFVFHRRKQGDWTRAQRDTCDPTKYLENKMKHGGVQ